MNARKFPEWGETFAECVTDVNGETTYVAEPCALALYPMSKTVNDTTSRDNAENMRYALVNNPDVNTEPRIVTSRGVLDIEGIF